MINYKSVALDQVLEEYALASECFDATVLDSFIQRYPEHAQPLRRYAQVQLTFVQPTREEVEAEALVDDELLPQQSKLLQRMQLRGTATSTDVAAAAEKVAAISGETQLMAAAQTVFSSTGHGEDLLLLSVTDSKSPVTDVPKWFYDGLGRSIGCPPGAVIQAIAMRRQPHVGNQRFSTQGKLAEPPPISWEKLVEDCISDEAVKRKILERS